MSGTVCVLYRPHALLIHLDVPLTDGRRHALVPAGDVAALLRSAYQGEHPHPVLRAAAEQHTHLLVGGVWGRASAELWEELRAGRRLARWCTLCQAAERRAREADGQDLGELLARSIEMAKGR